MKWGAHTRQLLLLTGSQEQNVKMFLLREDLGELRTDLVNERSVFWCRKAQGDMNSIRVFDLRQICALDLWHDEKLSNERRFEKALGLTILLTDEANPMLDMNLAGSFSFTPEH